MVGQHGSPHLAGLMVNGVPQPAFLFLAADQPPHLVSFSLQIFPLAQPHNGLSWL